MRNSVNEKKVKLLEKDLRKYISKDLKRDDSLIVNYLMKNFSLLKRESSTEIVDLKDVIPFMTIHTKDISSENAQDCIRKAMNNKLSNLGYRAGSSLTLLELFEFCSILKIQPETLLPNYNLSMLLPIEYCSIQQVQNWLSKARTGKDIAHPIYIPFQNAPIIGVSLGIHFSASKNDALENMIKACRPAEIGYKKFDPKTNQPLENYIQMQVVLIELKEGKKRYFCFEESELINEGHISKTHIRETLRAARRHYAKICIEKYKEAQKKNEYLSSFMDNGVLLQYYSKQFEEIFKNKLELFINEKQHKQERQSKLDDKIKWAMRSIHHA